MGRCGSGTMGEVFSERRIPARVTTPAHKQQSYVCTARGAHGVLPKAPRTATQGATRHGRRQPLRGRRVQQGAVAQS